MHTFHRSIATIAVALATLVAMTASAGANTITTSPGGAITATSLGKLTLSSSGGVINPSTQCDVSLTGSFNSSINNASGGGVGTITGGSATGCTVGSLRLLFSNPWGLILSGAMNLTALTMPVNITMVSFDITVAGTACLFSGTVPGSAQVSGGGPYTTGLITLGTNSIPKVSGSSLCPSTGRLSGVLSLSPAQTLTLS